MSEALSKVLQEVGTVAYQQASQQRTQQQPSSSSENQGKGDNVVDADYTVVDEDKK